MIELMDYVQLGAIGSPTLCVFGGAVEMKLRGSVARLLTAGVRGGFEAIGNSRATAGVHVVLPEVANGGVEAQIFPSRTVVENFYVSAVSGACEVDWALSSAGLAGGVGPGVLVGVVWVGSECEEKECER